MVAWETMLEAQVANCLLVPGCKIAMSFLGDEILDIGGGSVGIINILITYGI